jgi:hypothetical protein
MNPAHWTITLLFITISALRAETPPASFDFDKARQLFEKRKSGTTLTTDEETYIQQAMAARAAQNRAGGADEIDRQRAQDLFRREQRGEKLSEPDQKFLDRAKAARLQQGKARGPGGTQRKAPEHLTPLTDMSAEDRYEVEDGGLYGGGSNEPPEALQKMAEQALARIKPLDESGAASDSGKVVLVSISMSNATQEFSVFKRIADVDKRKSDKLTIVDCAQGGQTMAAWSQPEGRPWPEAMARLERAGVTPKQVQVAWVKLANAGPSGSMSDHLKILESDTVKVLHLLKQRFPNLQIAYLGSRIYGGYASTGLNPEPYAYEGAFAVRELIQRQLSNDPVLTLAQSPLLLWGPYLWADGEKGRKLDALIYTRDDFVGDGTHPSDAGRQKVAEQLLEFFANSRYAKGWFAR